MQVACISETEPDKICVGFLEIRPKQRRMEMKIGRGVSPLVQVLGTFNVKLSCARVSPIRMKRIGHNKD